MRDDLSMESSDNEDRISQLPDALLHHILSKVFDHQNTIDLIRMCILLSKRWSNLWVSFPHLYFDHWRLPRDSRKRENPHFARLVNAVLLCRDSSDVQRFFLRWTDSYGHGSDDISDEHGPHRLATWMQYAVNHNVKDLFIDFDLDEKLFKMPSSVFNCCSLVELNLDISNLGDMGTEHLEIPEFVQLGRLRKLRLDHFSLGPVSLKALLSGCPIVEDMVLSECVLRDPDICSNSLKKLDFSFCEIEGTRIRISVPSLRYLHLSYNDIDRLEVLLENLTALAKATLQTDDYGGHNFGDKGLKLLKYISPTSKLMAEKDLSVNSFPNLKKLHLEGSLIIDTLQIVAQFLHRSPNLELITLEKEVVISLNPALKKRQLMMDFDCPHLKDILAAFDETNDNIAELLTNFCDDKCGCFEE